MIGEVLIQFGYPMKLKLTFIHNIHTYLFIYTCTVRGRGIYKTRENKHLECRRTEGEMEKRPHQRQKY